MSCEVKCLSQAISLQKKYQVVKFHHATPAGRDGSSILPHPIYLGDSIVVVCSPKTEVKVQLLLSPLWRNRITVVRLCRFRSGILRVDRAIRRIRVTFLQHQLRGRAERFQRPGRDFKILMLLICSFSSSGQSANLRNLRR